jgi:hypothetical protein
MLDCREFGAPETIGCFLSIERPTAVGRFIVYFYFIGWGEIVGQVSGHLLPLMKGCD